MNVIKCSGRQKIIKNAFFSNFRTFNILTNKAYTKFNSVLLAFVNSNLSFHLYINKFVDVNV